MNKRFAFTLTEVMITMGIIGVIAALTVPNLVKNYQQNAQIVQIRKVTNDFVNAADMLTTEESKTKFSKTSIFTGVLENGSPGGGLGYFMGEKFKSNSVDLNKAFVTTYYAIEGTNHEESVTFCNGRTPYVLANSAAVCAAVSGNDVDIYIDTNGIDKPNIGGRDLFHVVLKGGGSDVTIEDHTNTDTGVTGCKESATGEGCYRALEEHGWTNMDTAYAGSTFIVHPGIGGGTGGSTGGTLIPGGGTIGGSTGGTLIPGGGTIGGGTIGGGKGGTLIPGGGTIGGGKGTLVGP